VLDAPLPQPVAPPLSARTRLTLFELTFAAATLLVLRRRWQRK